MSVTTAAVGLSSWFRTALLGLALTVGSGAALLLTGAVDPVDDLLSSEVATPSGALLLALACIGLAVTGAALAAGAGRALSRARLVRVLLAVWSTALLAVAFFPTNLPGTPVTAEAVAHRWGAALVAALPPLFGLLVAELAGRRAESNAVLALRAAALATLAACLLFAAVHGPAMLTDADRLPYAGLIERVLLALAVGTTALTAVVLRREADVGIPRRGLTSEDR